MTREEGIILSAYTGYLLVDNFADVHEFIENLLRRPVWTHQLADPAIQEEIRRECKPILPAVSEEVNRWIPVTERLPDTSGEYLTHCHHYRNGDWAEVVPFDAEKKYFVDLGRHYYPFVTHWMPLPEPPKED